MTIQVLGSGCPTCKKLYEIVTMAAKELCMDCDVEYITDIRRIIEMGIMSSPVLAVDGKPVMVGYTPDLEKIKKALTSSVSYKSTQNKCSCGGKC